jgi:hypothetical protein
MSLPDNVGNAEGVHAPERPQSWLGRIHPHFKDPEHVLVLKLDAFLLVWAFRYVIWSPEFQTIRFCLSWYLVLTCE